MLVYRRGDLWSPVFLPMRAITDRPYGTHFLFPKNEANRLTCGI